MCGITGIVDAHGRRPIDQQLVLRMRDSMITRGPDESGVLHRDGVGLAHRRLAIIDLLGGQQPMSLDGGSVSITFNGEIYNYKALAQELAALGHVCQTDSDTEVILHAWVQWGEKCVDRLRGMFAFAIWDESKQLLFLARDRLGIKPLLYAPTADGLFAFSSDIDALTLVPGVDLSMNLPSVEDYFTFGYIADPKTIYAGVHKLAPGHTLSLVRGKAPVINEYWDVAPSTNCPVDSREVQEGLIEHLTEAVDIRLMSEVPLGAFLSGGVDSSAVVAIMSELSDRRVTTCSVGFDEAAFDESAHASLVAERYSTNHHAIQVDASAVPSLETLTSIYGEPFADSSAIPTLGVCELARQHVTVALSGDGADEVLAGYRRQRLHMNEERVRQLLPDNVRARVFGPLGHYFPKADWAPRPLRAKTTLQALALDTVAAYFETVSQNSSAVREKLYSTDFKRRLGSYRSIDVFRHHAAKAPSADPLTQIQYLDLKTYLPGDILTKVDRASMQHSLEVRVPFLDHHLVNWCFGLEPRWRLSGGVGKRALKEAMESRLPSDVLYRPKMGFSVPLAAWTRGPMSKQVEDTLRGERLRDSGIFDVNRLDTIHREHKAGTADHATLLWSLLVFDSHLAAMERKK